MRVLLLAVVLGVGMSLSFSQASAMRAKMTVATEMAHAGSDGCHGCVGDDHGGADMSGCLSLCASAGQGLLAEEPTDLVAASGAGLEIAHMLVSGHVTTPDHGPPKLLILD